MAQLQITIDDGPEPVLSALNGILDEFDKRKVVGAFFNLGEEVKSSPGATQTILRRGHVLANHSWDHLMPKTSAFTDAELLDQFQRTHDEVLAVTKTAMVHWRAPRLEAILRLTRILTTPPKPGVKALYSLSHCDVHADSKDSQGITDAAGMLKALRADIALSPARKVFRLLFHVKSTSAAALPAVLDGLVKDGHTITDFAQSQ